MNKDRFNIGKIGISRVNLDKAVNIISECVETGTTGYICITNSRVVYQCQHDTDYCKIQNDSLLTTPDGKPLVWIAHNIGEKEVGRVCGPDLFPRILNISKNKGYSHYFYGSTQETIDMMMKKMKKEYPDVCVKGAVSPPYQPIEKFDIDALAKEINELKPTFFWVGLGAPKQERLMALLQPKLESTICIGVGLVFNYFAGNVKRAPKWMQKCGMEWLYRASQQPAVFKRFFVPFFYTIGLVVKSKLLKRI